MGRPRQADGRRITLSIKLSETEAKALDRARGSMSRSDYARQVLFGIPEPARRAKAKTCTHAYPDVRNVAGVIVCRICG